MKRIDLNVDIAEGFPFDDALLRIASSANVCCGVHAGSPELTRETVARCRERGVRVGAHPGFPDRTAMGRRMPAPSEWEPFMDSIRSQLRNFAPYRPAYVKPHGALYNWLARLAPDEVVEARRLLGWEAGPMMALAGSAWAEHWGPLAILEGFADRRTLADGTLAPRTEPGAVLRDPDEVAAQALRLAPRVDSICLHGDTEGCLVLAEAVARALRDAGWEIAA